MLLRIPHSLWGMVTRVKQFLIVPLLVTLEQQLQVQVTTGAIAKHLSIAHLIQVHQVLRVHCN